MVCKTLVKRYLLGKKLLNSSDTVQEVWPQNTVNAYIKIQYRKRHMAVIYRKLLSSFPILLSLAYHSCRFLMQFWEFSFLSLVVLSQLPQWPKSTENIYASWPSWLWGRAMPEPRHLVDEHPEHCCASLLFCWMAHGSNMHGTFYSTTVRAKLIKPRKT